MLKIEIEAFRIALFHKKTRACPIYPFRGRRSRCGELINSYNFTLKSYVIIAKTSWKLFKMETSPQTDKQVEKKILTINKKYILRKMRLKFQNPILNILSKIAFWDM